MKLAKNFKLLIFDIDDTLIQSEAINVEIIKEYFFKRFRISLTTEDIEFIYGHSWRAIYEMYIKKYSLSVSPEEVQKDIVCYKKEYLKINLPKVASGAFEVLQLPVKKCAVTGNGKEEALIMLESANLNKFIDAIFTVDEYKESKPSPAGYIMALDFFQVKPEEAIAFEDSESGLLAAKGAGIVTCFIKEFALKDYSYIADFSFKNFFEVRKFLVGE
jgi:HAD superfamily hydrolase (TIGR01509 family)